MKRTLPPLNALRTFETVARHLSFTKAADELLVTQAAVSHQIRNLSEFLSIPLFKRIPSGLELAPEAEELFEVTKRSLDIISSASETILHLRCKDENTLTVRVTPFFAKHMLAPIISNFLERNPNIKLRTAIGRHPLGSDLGSNDIVICTDEGERPGVDAYPILIAGMLPLCSPAVVRKKDGKLSPCELANHVVIRDVHADVWGAWMVAAGVGVMEPKRSIFTDDPHFAVEAGLNGDGVFFEAPIFVETLIRSGRLLMPCGDKFAVPIQYRILHTASSARKKKVRTFRDWLVREMAARSVTA